MTAKKIVCHTTGFYDNTNKAFCIEGKSYCILEICPIQKRIKIINEINDIHIFPYDMYKDYFKKIDEDIEYRTV